MENNKQTITIAFVLIIGLLGGYMIAQHVGHAAESHKAMHEEKDAGHHEMDDRMAPPHEEGGAPLMDGDMPGGPEAGVQLQ
jgi:hypothetical protein